MALQLSLIETREQFSGQLVFDDAYWKLNQISGTKNKITFFVQVQGSKGGPVLALKEYSFVPDMDGGNFIKQAYQFLKTLPEFSDATDC